MNAGSVQGDAAFSCIFFSEALRRVSHWQASD